MINARKRMVEAAERLTGRSLSDLHTDEVLLILRNHPDGNEARQRYLEAYEAERLADRQESRHA